MSISRHSLLTVVLWFIFKDNQTLSTPRGRALIVFNVIRTIHITYSDTIYIISSFGSCSTLNFNITIYVNFIRVVKNLKRSTKRFVKKFKTKQNEEEEICMIQIDLSIRANYIQNIYTDILQYLHRKQTVIYKKKKRKTSKMVKSITLI